MGGRFNASSLPFAHVANRIEPAALRNQIPRNGGKVLFPFGVDSLMILSTAEVLVESFSKKEAEPDPLVLKAAVFEKLKSLMETDVTSVSWGVGTRHVLQSKDISDSLQLRSNCGITRSLVSGLLDPMTAAGPVCAATHSHPSAIEGARIIGKSVEIAAKSGRMISPDDLVDSPSYHSVLLKAKKLASNLPYEEQDEFELAIQDKFKNLFGVNASSQCSVAAAMFSVYRTIHSLPHLDASSKEYIDRIKEISQSSEDRQKKGLGKNALGNSNRLDSSSLYTGLSPSIEQDLPVSLAVAWAISLGGDVRSNACLAGGIAGALWGEEAIPTEWLIFSEGVDRGRKLADELFAFVN
jgi:hypothetical protein